MSGKRFRQFVSCYARYKKPFIKVMLCALITSAAALILPAGIRSIADMTEPRAILRAAAVISGGIAVEMLSSWYFDAKGHELGARMENDLRMSLFSHLEEMSPSFYRRYGTGTLMSSLTNDLLDLTELFHHGPEDYVINAVRFTGAFIILFTINRPLAFLLLGSSVLMTAATVFWANRLKIISAENQANIASVNDGAEDMLSQMSVIQSYTCEKRSSDRFAVLGGRFFKSRTAIYFNESYADKTTLFFTRFTSLAIAALGAVYAARGDITYPDLIAFLLYTGYVTEPVQKLNWMMTQFRTGLAGFDRVMTIMETAPDIQSGKTAPAAVLGGISMDSVVFGYVSGRPVLDGLSLDIAPGDTVVLTGGSGCGKSTLAALISRFYDPSSGVIRFDGLDIREMPVERVRASVAYVCQEPGLFDTTVRENILMGRPDASEEDIRRAAEAADALGFIEKLPKGFDSPVGPRGSALSGGQRQRIALARAILKDAPVMVLDEAASALDEASERRVYAALGELRQGRTTVIITHRPASVACGKRTYLMKDGRLTEI